MSMRTLLIGILALAFGVSAAVGVNLFARQRNASVDTVAIVVADADLSRGDTIRAEQLKLSDCPRELVPVGVVTDLEDARGRVVRHPIQKDEPILDVKLAPRGAKQGLAGLIPPGMRAFTIQTPNVAANVAGFLLPGNRVDVLLTVNGDDRSGGGLTTTLLQNVEILGVDNIVDTPNERKVDARHLQSVTLLVTPDQAAVLDLGQNRGTLHLSLRNPDDSKHAKNNPATMRELQLLEDRINSLAQKPAAAKPAEKRPLEIRLLNGQYYTVVPIDARDAARTDAR